MRSGIFIFVVVMIWVWSCNPPFEQPAPETPADDSLMIKKDTISVKLSHDELYDKVLGMLVGSAIGDAMGAPTEMWLREDIVTDYGFVEKLDTMVREPSAEGTWDYNLPAGGTTDDTRWKKLLTEFLLTQSKELSAKDFAGFIVKKYEQEIHQLKQTDGFDPEPFEINVRRVAWLQEWARVAKPYAEGNLDEYSFALSRFYGGEMTCAGMLYAPSIGAFYPAQPKRAYLETYKLAVFDLGFARDISGLVGAMVAAAIQPQATSESVINTLRDVDPHGYFKSRLVGRTAYRLLKDARRIVRQAKQTLPEGEEISIEMPTNSTLDTLTFWQMQRAFALLDAKNQDMPFHAGEIFLVNLTALLFCDFDFTQSMAFVVNFGRDNDTTAAVTGAILGAYYGADQLPEEMVNSVLSVNDTVLDVNLEELASQLTDRILSR
ncbi:ADP-ribosylglycohydrolase family protein [Tunicatimonas pelagia]|uniref:ADP-ribosylglycohydrolase family protein n=1 Tax=Tunicatimonas pelagia TaxID=931531 RepID=UPI0026668CE5|nr:ADP-ribosylglycohydrolase family protein [Tunicatimonas pelagia]WKN41572.1 ADP-ribosylglycohydrolase family protein [Tunicatimonas pelagia]